MKSSWRTSLLGILGIVSALCGAATLAFDDDPKTNPDWLTVSAAISTSVGLMAARDNKVTSEQVGAK